MWMLILNIKRIYFSDLRFYNFYMLRIDFIKCFKSLRMIIYKFFRLEYKIYCVDRVKMFVVLSRFINNL